MWRRPAGVGRRTEEGESLSPLFSARAARQERKEGGGGGGGGGFDVCRRRAGTTVHGKLGGWRDSLWSNTLQVDFALLFS